MRWRPVVIGAVVMTLTALTPSARAAEPLVEDRVIAMINAERSSRLVVHFGLLNAARAHSQRMASEGGLSHEDADARVNAAAPDPGEFNGAPDDGFGIAAWCENVTYTIVASAEEAAQRIYSQWHKGGAHERCMLDTSRNVGAVGVYYDGQNWWATFIAEKDSTPPGGAAPAAKPKPAAPADRQETPKPEPRATAAPDADDAPPAASASDDATAGDVVRVEATPQPVGLEETTEDEEPPSQEPQATGEPATVPVVSEQAVARPDVRAIAEGAAVPIVPAPGIGWREIAAVVAVLSVATVMLRRTMMPATRPGAEPIVFDIGEPAVVRGEYSLR